MLLALPLGRREAEPEVPGRPDDATGARQVVRRFLRHRLAVLGLVILAALAVLALFGRQIAPHDPNAIIADVTTDAPSPGHPLGLDPVGRDNLSRLIDATRISLSVGVGSVAIYVTIGVILGAIAGYFGGWVDMVIMRLADVVLSFPTLMLILVVTAVVGPSFWNVILVLGLLGWPPVARLVRGEFLTLREREFTQAARALGARDSRIIFRHILPNASGPILVAATFGTAQAILVEAALSFLGLGVQPPQASWGNMLIAAQSLTVLEEKPWMWLPPGLMIFISVLAINFVGDGLRDALDPRLRR
ncbi:MAG: ABC transporter permease [Bacillota bacterium]|nr:MAG: peptide ABC transporter permease [Bacillota bacterium]